jgi:glutamine synthetase
VFSDLDDPQRMTAEAEHLTAGLLDLLEPGAALLAGNTTSYVRLSPGRWAGGMICWGVRNREAALRFLPAEDLSSRHAANVELKTPDGLSNHYLVAAFALAAAMHGLEQRPALPEPVTGDPAQLDHAGKTRHQVRAFPSDLGEALQRLDASHTLRKLLGDELVDTYCAVRAAEWHQHRHEPLSAQIAATLLRY